MQGRRHASWYRAVDLLLASTMGMLLVAAAASLLLVSALQVPPLASSAGYRGYYASPTRSPNPNNLFRYPMNRFKDFLKKHGPDVVDVGQQILPLLGGSSPYQPPPGGSSPYRPPPAPPGDSAPAETTAVYLVDLQVGTPAQTISGVLDISTQLMWMQCSGLGTIRLLDCASDYCPASIRQTCAQTNDRYCSYVATDSNNMSMAGYLVWDTFTFGPTAVQDMLFGCSTSTEGDYSGTSGVIGLGRGPLSLVSQLGVYNFSYFLAPYGYPGSLFQLDGAVPRRGSIRSTPLHNSTVYTNLYYVRLIGIHVGGVELDGIPPGTFDLQTNGSGGVFLSTTVPFTYLLLDAYKVVRQAFESRISQSGPQPVYSGDSLYPLCYTAQSMAGVKVPGLTLVFDGEDAVMELSTANYFFKFNDGASDLECLSVLPSVGASLLGSLVQTNTTMIYDLVNEQLTFVMQDASPSQAAPLVSEAQASLAVVVAVAVWVLLF